MPPTKRSISTLSVVTHFIKRFDAEQRCMPSRIGETSSAARSEKWANAISIVSNVRTFSIFAIACALYGRDVVSSPQMWWPLSESGLSSGRWLFLRLLNGSGDEAPRSMS